MGERCKHRDDNPDRCGGFWSSWVGRTTGAPSHQAVQVKIQARETGFPLYGIDIHSRIISHSFIIAWIA